MKKQHENDIFEFGTVAVRLHRIIVFIEKSRIVSASLGQGHIDGMRI